MNTECITLGGLNKQQVLTSAERVHTLWQRLLALCPEDGTEVRITAADIHSPTFPIVWSDPRVEYDSIIIQKRRKRLSATSTDLSSNYVWVTPNRDT
jgi:hypothetical protein